jgi:hypothetical protein
MRLKSTLTIVAIAVLAFGMIFATSAAQIDKIFADPVIGEQNHVDANGGKPSDVFGNFFGGSNPVSSSSSNPDHSVFGDIFGNFFNPSSSKTSPSTDIPSSSKTSPSTDIPSSSTNSDQPCKQDNSQKGTHFYCEGTHHHCKPGPDNPKCVKT